MSSSKLVAVVVMVFCSETQQDEIIHLSSQSANKPESEPAKPGDDAQDALPLTATGSQTCRCKF
jgi:hypothetical protein